MTVKEEREAKELAADNQRRIALARANMVRGQRAIIRNILSSAPVKNEGFRRLADLLEAEKQFASLEGMTVSDLLRMVKGCGPLAARTVLHDLELSNTRRVGELTERQREQLTLYLRAR